MQPNLAEAERRIEEARRTQGESLDLGDLALPELPGSLGDLRHLKALKLGRVIIFEEYPEFTDLTPLSGLQGLQSLNLEGTGVTDLSPLSGLRGLQSLDLSGTSVEDLSPLSRLRGLQSLDLSFTNVLDLSPLSGLQGLQSLDLDHTGVKDLSPLSRFQSLRSLNLQICCVKDLSPLSGLQGLQTLNLYGCQPAVPAILLRVLADHPRLAELVADEAVGVPQEILSHEVYDNCLLRLRAYSSELALGAEAENEVKVILLGNGRVGKTQLCRRFRGQPFDESVQSTHGVQIWREELRIRTDRCSTPSTPSSTAAGRHLG